VRLTLTSDRPLSEVARQLKLRPAQRRDAEQGLRRLRREVEVLATSGAS
jgi:hypothetical protein